MKIEMAGTPDLWTLLFLFGAFSLTAAQSLDAFPTTRNEGVIIPGIYIEEIEDLPLHFYEKLVPIVFEFKLYPELALTGSASTLSSEPRILPRFLCRSEVKSPPSAGWAFACPVFYHMSSLLTSLKTELTDIFPGRNPSNRYESNRKFMNPSLLFNPDCQEEAWAGITARDGGLAEYRFRIEKCALASYFEEDITDFNSTINTAIHEKMRDNFLMTYVNYTTTEGGDSVAMLLALQSMLTLQSVAELSRWREANSDCRNNFIPYSLVKQARLEKAVQNLRTQLRATSTKYVPIFTAAQLYQYPVADCIPGSNSYFVRILVPVRKEASVYRPLRLASPQFLYNDEICRVTSRGLGQGNFVLDKVSKTVFGTQCDFQAGGLCRADRGLEDRCLNAITADKAVVETLRSDCDLNCERMGTETKLPLIQRVASNKFLVTTNRITTMLIKCEGLGRPDELVPPQKYGAVEITLPCGCHLMFHSERFYPLRPCSTLVSSVVVHHALPVQMINTSFSFPYMRPGFQSSRISSYYTARYTLLNLVNYVNMTFREKDVEEVDLGMERPVEEERSQEQAVEVNETVERARACCNSNNGGYGHTSLWVLILLQVFLTFGLGLVLFCKIYVLNKRLEANSNVISFSTLQTASTSQMTLADKYA